MDELAFVVSTIAGVVSIALAIFAIWIARAAERESRENYKQTRDLLAEVERTAGITETIISQSHRQLQDTLITLVTPKPTVDPASNQDAEMGLRLFESLIQSNPNNFPEVMRALTSLAPQAGSNTGSGGE